MGLLEAGGFQETRHAVNRLRGMGRLYILWHTTSGMLIQELTPTQCADLLQRTAVGRLACANHGQPYVVPVSFSFDRERGCVYGVSTVGQKIQWLRENPLVCLEVDDVQDKNHWQTVVIFGRYEEIQDSPEEAEARQRAQVLFQQRSEWWFPAIAKVGPSERHAIVVYRIHIDRISGRRAARNPPFTTDTTI